MNLNKMLFKLYAFPILLLVGSLIVPYILSTVIPNHFAQSAILTGIGKQTQSIAPMAGLILLGASLLWGLFSSFELWQWTKGRGGETCHNCGGMTEYHPNGRYGPYFKCIACGKNRSDR
jgi:hypothetical protein